MNDRLIDMDPSKFDLLSDNDKYWIFSEQRYRIEILEARLKGLYSKDCDNCRWQDEMGCSFVNSPYQGLPEACNTCQVCSAWELRSGGKNE